MKGAWFKSAEASVFVERKYHDPRSAVALDGDGVPLQGVPVELERDRQAVGFDDESVDAAGASGAGDGWEVPCEDRA